MKCLSVREPWAWLMTGAPLEIRKDVENRTWFDKYRGPLLIHAGRRFDYDALLWLGDHVPEAIEPVCRHFHIRFDESTCQPVGCDQSMLGGIVGMVYLDRIVRNHPSRWAQPECWHWQVSGGRALPFIPLKGQLRLFEVTIENSNIMKAGD